MTSGILAFALGIAWLQYQPALPGLGWLFGAGVTGLMLLGLQGRLGRGRRSALVLGGFLLGWAWGGIFAQQRLADALGEGSEGVDLEVTGVVAALPQQFENGWRFEFDVEQASQPVPRHISLAWYRSRLLDEDGEEIVPRPVRAGERWHFTVRLKRPHGNLNPHGFDYEAWLFEQGIRATGYVRPRGAAERLSPFVWGASYGVERMRQDIRDRFAAVLGPAQHGGILAALAVGDQRAIPAEQWQVFSRTGLTHLLSVSGLHITMVAGLVYALVGGLWRRSFFTSAQLPLYLPAQQAAALGGMGAAFAYCLLSGFAVPAQRTLYMLTVVGLALFLRRSLAVRQVLGMALGLVLVLDPLAVTSAGFWLSFGAVALLFYIGSHRIGELPWLAAQLTGWGRAQWAMTVGMIPLMLALFQQFSLVSPLANAVGIPLVSFVITPLALLAAVPGLEFLLHPALWITDQLMAAVRWLAATPWAVWQQQAPPVSALAVGLLGTLWLLAPRGFPARWVGAVLFLPLFFLPPARPMSGAAHVVLLDVGQGLALHVQTANHDLVFDTGPAFSPDANSGNRIIVPYLRATGVRRLDGVVVSHGDKDHSGGAAPLLEEVPTDWLLHALPADHPLLASGITTRPCFDGQAWDWDGVRFQLLHPRFERHADPTRKTNDMSCVLRVEAGGQVLLVTSDIEAPSEAELLKRHGGELHADVLIAPHHGSRTSSTEAFVAAVDAPVVLFPVGYRNRFGHPKAEIMERYAATKAALYRTDQGGALMFDLGSGPLRVAQMRIENRHYWGSP